MFTVQVTDSVQDFVWNDRCFVNVSSSSKRGQCVELSSHVLAVDNLTDHGITPAAAPSSQQQQM